MNAAILWDVKGMNSRPLMNEVGNVAGAWGDNCQAIDRWFAGVVFSQVRLKTYLPVAKLWCLFRYRAYWFYAF